MFRFVTTAIASTFLAALFAHGPALAQTQALPPEHHVPGKPWTSIIPDPDRYDWPAQGARPGYQYRGMTPTQERFYDYIQAKRRAGTALSAGDEAMIRRLVVLRRWPESPRPNPFWAAFMRYLRNLDRPDLNTAQSIMLDELRARGLVPVDPEMTPEIARLRDYLNSRPFEARNWFERTFGRVEPWMEHFITGYGYDMRTAAPAGNAFPSTGEFNGMVISYNVSGATLAEPKETEGFTCTRSFKGVISPGTLRVSGRVTQGRGYGAKVTVRVWAGGKEEKTEYYMERQGDGAVSRAYDLSIPVPAGTTSAGFIVRLDGSYSMGGGHRGLQVSGSFTQSASDRAAQVAAGDAAWRAQVEETLQRLGYQDTPEGQAVKEMRVALRGGDAAWKRWVDRKQKELGYDDSPKANAYRELEAALNGTDAQWQEYARTHSGGTGAGGAATPPATSSASAPDVGALGLGSALANGTLQNAGTIFTGPSQVACRYDFQNLPQGSAITATWTRDGKDVVSSSRTVGGSGWVSFSLQSGGTGALTPGAYTVTLRLGTKVLARKSFTVKAR